MNRYSLNKKFKEVKLLHRRLISIDVIWNFVFSDDDDSDNCGQRWPVVNVLGMSNDATHHVDGVAAKN
jgi:hypothetical protein